MKDTEKTLFFTSHQRILAFLADNPEEEFTEKEISKGTGFKKSAVNLALHELTRIGILKTRKIGRSSLFKADLQNTLIREIKIIRNIMEIALLISKLKKISDKIILFGSAAEGTNDAESDLDIFVLTVKPKEAHKIVNDSSLSEKIQLIAKTPKEMLSINKRKPLFFSEIAKGKVLWERNEQSGI